MTKLSDTQAILLSSAAQRANGSLLPLPATLKGGGGTSKAINTLIKIGLAEERETRDTGASRRVEGDLHYGVFITAAGEAAIGIEQPNTASMPTRPPSPATKAAPVAKSPSKSASVIALLTRPEGATLPELIEATGWLPHSTRAALTGIRKKGREVTRGKRDGATCYRIVEAA